VNSPPTKATCARAFVVEWNLFFESPFLAYNTFFFCLLCGVLRSFVLLIWPASVYQGFVPWFAPVRDRRGGSVILGKAQNEYFLWRDNARWVSNRELGVQS
ncbi:unnamed protein product, partial [Ectocarpus sp. 12 AP-2014]